MSEAIFNMWLACYTQQEIADEVGVSQTEVDRETKELPNLANLPKRVKLHALYQEADWEPPETLTIEEWQSVGEMLKLIDGAVMWWLGDWLAFGERKYGEMYAQALGATEYKYQALADAVWVSNNVEFSVRTENLTWSHHKYVAALWCYDAEGTNSLWAMRQAVAPAEAEGGAAHSLAEKGLIDVAYCGGDYGDSDTCLWGKPIDSGWSCGNGRWHRFDKRLSIEFAKECVLTTLGDQDEMDFSLLRYKVHRLLGGREKFTEGRTAIMATRAIQSLAQENKIHLSRARYLNGHRMTHRQVYPGPAE